MNRLDLRKRALGLAVSSVSLPSVMVFVVVQEELIESQQVGLCGQVWSPYFSVGVSSLVFLLAVSLFSTLDRGQYSEESRVRRRKAVWLRTPCQRTRW